MAGLDAVKAATRGMHARAERSGVIADMLAGQASFAAMTLLLRGLLPVYQTLDASEFGGAALARTAAIKADLRLLAPGTRVKLLPEGTAYAERVRAAGGALVAHAYVRYLGDLNGGPVLRRCLGPAGASMAYFAHPKIADRIDFMRNYRARLDHITQAGDFDTILQEVIVAFEMTIALSEAVKIYTDARKESE